MNPRAKQNARPATTQRMEAALLCDYLRTELEQKQRIVCENDSFVAVVPFWAVWPFETLLLSREHIASFDAFSLRRHAALPTS